MVATHFNPRDCWATPRYIVDAIVDNLGKSFDLDVCAFPETSKARRHLIDGEGEWAEINWSNPPYSRIGHFVRLALGVHNEFKSLTVMLLPARADQAWFAELLRCKVPLDFYRGRIRFEPPPGIKDSQPREPSILAWVGWPERSPRVRDAKTGRLV